MTQKEFHLVCQGDLDVFEETVTELLNSGWAPIGGIAVSEGSLGTYYYIGMVKTVLPANATIQNPD